MTAPVNISVPYGTEMFAEVVSGCRGQARGTQGGLESERVLHAVEAIGNWGETAPTARLYFIRSMDPLTPPPEPAEPHAPAVSTWRRGATAGVFLVVVFGVMAGLLWSARETVSAEERGLVGFWYGHYRNEAEGRNYSWFTEYRRDHTMHSTFRYYHGSPGMSAWQCEDSIEHGEWYCREGGLQEIRRAEGRQRSVGARLWHFVTAWEWLRNKPFTPSYDVTRVETDDLRYTSRTSGRQFHAIRVLADFVLPAEPTTVEEVRAGWAGSSGKMVEAP